MHPEVPSHVFAEEFTPFVERAMQEADVVVIDHWIRRRRPGTATTPACYLFADSELEDEPDHPVSSHAEPTPHLPIET